MGGESRRDKETDDEEGVREEKEKEEGGRLGGVGG